MQAIDNNFDSTLMAVITANNVTTDRMPGDMLTLPNTFTDLKIKANDYVIADTINYSLGKLYQNWIYMIAKSIIP